jgi:hypothetical protein
MGSALRPRDGSEPPFQVFLLSLVNRSRSRVQFQPGNVVRILDNLKFQDHIQDYTDFYRFLAHEEKDPESLETIKEAFFDSALTLEPGDEAERLLFFKPPPEKGWKTLTILISHFQVGTETHAASVPFHRGKKR